MEGFATDLARDSSTTTSLLSGPLVDRDFCSGKPVKMMPIGEEQLLVVSGQAKIFKEKPLKLRIKCTRLQGMPSDFGLRTS